MVLPTNRAPGGVISSSDVNAIATDVNSTITRVTTLETGSAGLTSGALGALRGEVYLDDMVGTTASDKLDSAIAYCITKAPYYPIIRMSAKKYTFTRSINQPYNGFSLVGAGYGQLGAVSTGHPNYHTLVQMEIPRKATGTPGYFIEVATGSTLWDVYIGGFATYSDNGFTQFVRAPGATSTQIRECNFHDLTFQNYYSVFGNAGEYLAMTICNLTGGWSIFESRSMAVHIGGSDNRQIFGQGVDFYNSANQNGGQQFMMQCSSLQKSNLGPMYFTAEKTWRALKVTGGTSAAGLVLTGGVIEGANAGATDPNAPCDGALVRIESGGLVLRDTSINFAMKTPSLTATPNGGTADRGLVEVLGVGQLVMDGCSIGHAVGVANTTPAVYAAGTSEVRVRNMQYADRGGSAWGAQRPVISQLTTGRFKDYDTSVTLV